MILLPVSDRLRSLHAGAKRALSSAHSVVRFQLGIDVQKGLRGTLLGSPLTVSLAKQFLVKAMGEETAARSGLEDILNQVADGETEEECPISLREPNCVTKCGHCFDFDSLRFYVVDHGGNQCPICKTPLTITEFCRVRPRDNPPSPVRLGTKRPHEEMQTRVIELDESIFDSKLIRIARMFRARQVNFRLVIFVGGSQEVAFVANKLKVLLKRYVVYVGRFMCDKYKQDAKDLERFCDSRIPPAKPMILVVNPTDPFFKADLSCADEAMFVRPFVSQGSVKAYARAIASLRSVKPSAKFTQVSAVGFDDGLESTLFQQ